MRNIVNNCSTTELGFFRIKRNLSLKHLSNDNLLTYLREVMNKNPLLDIETRGKNYYFKSIEFKIIITVNKSSLGIITAHKIKTP